MQARDLKKVKTMDKINDLSFKMFDPIEAKEPWAVDYGSKYKVGEVVIDGKDMLDVIREIEKPYLQTEGLLHLQNDGGDYGHLFPKDLYDSLLSATVEGSFAHDRGVYLFCCGDCGEVGCWSVTFRVREDEEFVYWYGFKHEHRDWAYNLSYKFEKKAYQIAMDELRKMADHQEREKSAQ